MKSYEIKAEHKICGAFCVLVVLDFRARNAVLWCLISSVKQAGAAKRLLNFFVMKIYRTMKFGLLISRNVKHLAEKTYCYKMFECCSTFNYCSKHFLCEKSISLGTCLIYLLKQLNRKFEYNRLSFPPVLLCIRMEGREWHCEEVQFCKFI